MSAQRLYHNMPYSVVAFVVLVPIAAVWVFLIGGAEVRFYVADPTFSALLNAALRLLEKELPQDAILELAKVVV
jgi:hypothetical protein